MAVRTIYEWGILKTEEIYTEDKSWRHNNRTLHRFASRWFGSDVKRSQNASRSQQQNVDIEEQDGELNNDNAWYCSVVLNM